MMMSVAEIIISLTLVAIIIHLFALNRYITRKLDRLDKTVEVTKI